jgi:hypothetical protein
VLSDSTRETWRFPPADTQKHSTTLDVKCTPSNTKAAGTLRTAEGQHYTSTTHQIVKRKKSMVTISFFVGPYRSLKRSDTVTASKVHACIEMGSLLHSC